MTRPPVAVQAGQPLPRPGAAEDDCVVWIHTAAAPSLGFGHLRRCLVLARLLRADGIGVLFLLAADDAWSGPLVEEGGYGRVRIGPDIRWPAAGNPAVLLIDVRGSRHAAALCLEAKRRAVPVLSIHDLGLDPLPSDVVIDGSVAPRTSGFPGSPTAHLGPLYTVLDCEFGSLHARRKEIRHSIRKVVVALGGGDAGRYFPRILEGLRLWGRPVEATGFPGFARWGQGQLGLLDWSPVRFRWAAAAEPVAEILFDADLAFTAGGLSVYESLCAGTPALGLAYDEHQHLTLSRLADLGACIDLGMGAELPVEGLPGFLERLEGDHGLRARLSERGRELVDGAGAHRVEQLVRAAARRNTQVC